MKRFICTVLAAVMLTVVFTATASAETFSDVKADRWSYQDISYAVEKGYLKGVGGGLFDPEGACTRAMVVTVLYRVEGEPKVTAKSPFTDVPSGEWYYNAVIWAQQKGIVKGTSATTYAPDEKVTREQLATIFCRYASFKKYLIEYGADLSKFSDINKISSYAVKAIEWAVTIGLIKGVTDRTVEPGGFATREQFAAIMVRFVRYPFRGEVELPEVPIG